MKHTLTCDFCEHRCTLAEGKIGRCGIRQRKGDEIVTVNYGEHVSLSVDPVEKKPLYHFLPGSSTLSSALYGCNFTCDFCQNCTISQPELFRSLRTHYIDPEELARDVSEGSHPSCAFTYSEPSVWQDYMLDAGTEVHRRGGRNIMVTNGFFTPESLERYLPVIDAFNIDLKGDEGFYRKLCSAHVDPVVRNIRDIMAMQHAPSSGGPNAASPVVPHLEVTTMLLGEAHSREEIQDLARILDEAGVQVWHLSAFRPAYRMHSRAPTRESFVEEIYDWAREHTGIPHIYAFSSARPEFQNTYCPECGTEVITRRGFALAENRLTAGCCPECGREIYGRFAA